MDTSDLAISSDKLELHPIYSKYNKDITSKEYWEGVAKCKKQFITHGEDPRNNPFIRWEVAESWIRSKKFGVDVNTRTLDLRMGESDFQRLQEKNKLLIKIANPLIKVFMELATSSGYTLGLFDQDGAFLAGTHQKLSDSDVTVIWNEKTTGTTAHGLAILHNRPFQLIGPENYLKCLENNINSAAPITDENGKVIGALVLNHNVGKEPWKEELSKIQSHSLGWVSSLAFAIGSQIKLLKSNNCLKKANEIQGITLELFDEGIITIDSDGTILQLNKEARKILHLDQKPLRSHNINEYLCPHSSLLEMINSKKNIDYLEELIKVGNEERSYIISIRPVFKLNSNELDSIILKFDHPEKLNALVTSRSGADARFSFDDIIGESQAMVKSKKLAMRFSDSKENILILGESGTGKELFAQAIHNSHSSGPFIAVNCAAMPRNLIESELFGYERGAFTGAEKNGRPGKIELADGGTLFLDEIGDMPYELQAVILRVLQDKMVMRLGGRRYRKINFRLITATNQNLQELIKNRLFRDDLYFRLSVLNIEIPPLRNRGSDIIILAEYFVKRYALKMGRSIPSISSAVRKIILEYNWPGNVRQLENAMIYAVNLAEDKMIDIEHLPKEILSKYDSTACQSLEIQPKNSPEVHESQSDNFYSMKDFEKYAIEKALAKSGNVANAANLLEISIPTLYRKLKQYNIPY